MKNKLRVMKRILIISIYTLFLFIIPKSQFVEAHHVDVFLSGYGKAEVDGILNSCEWYSAGKKNFQVNLPGNGGTVPGKLFVMNDDIDLYIGISFPYTASGNSASIEFDNDHDDYYFRREPGDDAIIVNPSIGFYDLVGYSEPPCPKGVCSGRDIDLGGTSDGTGGFSNAKGITVYEFSHPLNSGDDAHDFSLYPGDLIGFHLSVRLLNPPSEYPIDFGDTGFPYRSYGDIKIAGVPEPSTLLLLGSGLLVLAGLIRKRFRK